MFSRDSQESQQHKDYEPAPQLTIPDQSYVLVNCCWQLGKIGNGRAVAAMLDAPRQYYLIDSDTTQGCSIKLQAEHSVRTTLACRLLLILAVDHLGLIALPPEGT